MSRNREHAVVIGASMAGLLAAKVLSGAFERVTVVERDELPADAALRKGVPQAAHAHGLLPGGSYVMERLFPGLLDDLAGQGAPRGDLVADFLWFQSGRWKLRHDSGLRGISVSRPCLESAIRSRVRGLANVAWVENAEARPVAGDGGRIGGVNVRRKGASEDEWLATDLVLDASGRGSQAPKWLEEWGYGRPPELVVKVDVGYGTRVFERKPGDMHGAMGAIIASSAPSTRYAAVLAAEGDRWMVTLAGMLGDYPPTDDAGWMAFAQSLPMTDVYELARNARLLAETVTYRFSANQRRQYEKMKRFPAGFLVTGDAVCSFNPIYGQGMSAAALEAEALGKALAAPGKLAVEFYQRVGKIVDIPWTIATGEDFRYPSVEGKRPAGFSMLSRYLTRVHAVASTDPVVCTRFFQVASLLAAPQSLLSPGMVRRVLFTRPPAGPGSPELQTAAT